MPWTPGQSREATSSRERWEGEARGRQAELRELRRRNDVNFGRARTVDPGLGTGRWGRSPQRVTVPREFALSAPPPLPTFADSAGAEGSQRTLASGAVDRQEPATASRRRQAFLRERLAEVRAERHAAALAATRALLDGRGEDLALAAERRERRRSPRASGRPAGA